jgi:hypothetical protein
MFDDWRKAWRTEEQFRSGRLRRGRGRWCQRGGGRRRSRWWRRRGERRRGPRRFSLQSIHVQNIGTFRAILRAKPPANPARSTEPRRSGDAPPATLCAI